MSTVDKDINHLQPAFRAKVEAWLARLKAAGIEMRVTETLRSFERQQELYDQGRTDKSKPKVTNAKPGQSNHNYGLSFDAYPVIAGKLILNFDKSPVAMAAVKAAAVIAKELGIHWGIAPEGQPVKDMPHWQDENIPHWSEAAKKWPGGWKPGTSEPEKAESDLDARIRRICREEIEKDKLKIVQ